MQNKTPNLKKSVNQPQTKNKVKICFCMSGIVMWALLLKYVVMMRAGPEKAIQPSIQQGAVRFRMIK